MVTKKRTFPTDPTKLLCQNTKVILLLVSQSGKSEEIFSALVTLGYPQIVQSSDRQVEYLVVSDYDEEMEFDSKVRLEYQKGKNGPAETAQNGIQITWNRSQELKTLPGTVSKQLSATISVLEDLQQRLHLDSNGSPVKAQDQNTQMTSDSKCEHVSITPGGFTGYVGVDEEKRDQKPVVGEDYSMVSDVNSDNILVLQESIPVKGHKEVKWDKTSGAEETGGVIEPLGYMETVTFSSGS